MTAAGCYRELEQGVQGGYEIGSKNQYYFTLSHQFEFKLELSESRSRVFVLQRPRLAIAHFLRVQVGTVANHRHQGGACNHARARVCCRLRRRTDWTRQQQ